MSLLYVFCFFKQKTAYEMRISDWSSDVCSSDLYLASSLDVFRQFLNEASTIYKAIEGSGTTADIAVQSVNTITKGRTYQVEFQMTTKAATGDRKSVV